MKKTEPGVSLYIAFQRIFDIKIIFRKIKHTHTEKKNTRKEKKSSDY